MKLAMILIMVLLTGACESLRVMAPPAQQLPNTGNTSEIMVGGIRATLTLEPAVVERTHSFRVTLTLRNTLSTASSWTSGMGCIAFLNVWRDGQRVPLGGTDFACLAVVTIRTLQPGETLVTSWDLVAQTTDGSPLLTGEYIFEADPVLSSRQTLRHRFLVR
jgi:hypothetical protein